MRTRIIVVVALTLAAAGVPLNAGAQGVDPCEPVPIPGLCASPTPEPSIPPLPGSKPSPTPTPKNGGKGKHGGGSTGPVGPAAPGAAPGSQAPFVISGPNSSARVIDLLTQLIPLGIPLDESIRQVVGPFPVAGAAWWTNDWHACRAGCTRLHMGLDIFAPHGTPLVAAADGFLSQKGAGGLCGIYVEVTDAHGIQYFYCHMSAHGPGLRVGMPLKVGQLVGFVGNTGNARFTPSHVHFEFQPGGVPAPPKPWVDRWVKIAEQRAADLVTRLGGTVPTAPAGEGSTFRLTRLFDLAGGGSPEGVSGEGLLFAGLQPGLSTLELTGQTLDQMAWEIDWGGQVDQQLGTLVRDYRAYLAGQAVASLSPWPFSTGTATGVPVAGDASD